MNDGAQVDHRPRPGRLTGGESSPSASDSAFLRAIRAWGGGDFEGRSARLSETWRERLRPSWESTKREKPDAAWSALRSDHEASSRPDPLRVHPSWYVRALKSESVAVQRAVAAHSTGPVRDALRRGLGLDESDLAVDRVPDRDSLCWALALWTERLVGDVPGLDSDPPVVVAMTRLGLRDLARLVRACGVAKHAFAVVGNARGGIDESTARYTPSDRVRLAFLRRHIGEADPRLVPLAKLDLELIEGDRRRGLAMVGLVTFGRLLSAVEPHRARWALQHIPYPIAKRMRPKGTPPLSQKALIAWESWVLEASWSRLLSEGWLSGGSASKAEAGSGVQP